MSFLSPLLWSFLPARLTHFILPTLSQILPAVFPPAQRGSPTYTRNYRYAYTLVVTLYLSYSFVSDGASIAGEDWYALLGVGRLAEDDTLRKAFRTLSRTYHPDRSSSPSSDDTFILLRRAYETLSNPTTRYAYDRFGPDIHTWGLEQTTTTAGGSKVEPGVKEWMMAGLMRSCGFYVVSGGIMALLALLGTARDGAYWRLTFLLLLLTAELLLVLSPTPPGNSSPLFQLFPALPTQLASFFSPIQAVFNLLIALILLPARSFFAKPQFLQVRTLHRLFTSLSIGVSQLAGVWSANSPESERENQALWAQVMAMSRGLQMEAIAGFQNDVVPMLSGPDVHQVEELLKNGMEQVLVDKALSSYPATRSQWHEASLRAQHSISLASTRAGAFPFATYPSTTGLQSGQQAMDRNRDLELARRIALPPSPPPSPRPGLRELV